MKNITKISIGLLVILTSLSGIAIGTPSEGFNLHIDAQKHFPDNPDMVAHHYCKTVSDNLIECLLFDSDKDDAKLIGIETVVGAESYNTFSTEEKALWHYHKTEIPKVNATLPDLSPEEAAKVVKSLEETYGKVYVLWEPGNSKLPIGKPVVYNFANPASKGVPKTPGFTSIVAISLFAGIYMIRRHRKKDKI